MEQKALVFEKQCINKNAFHKHKHLIDINKVGIDNIVISSKFHVAKRVHFNVIGYITNYVKPLWIKLPQLNGNGKYFDNNKSVNLLVHDKKLLIKYNAIWDKISNLLKIGFDREPAYNDKYIKTKIRICNDRIIQAFMITKCLKIMNVVLVYL